MSRKKNTKRPRSMSIGIGIEAGSEIEFRWNKEAQTLAYRVKKDGKTVKPVNTMIGLSYDRPNKNPKFLTMSSSPTLPPLLDFNEVLTRFTYIVAVDTSYKDVGKDKICATCIIISQIQEAPAGLLPIFKSAYGMEFWNPVGHPERFGWKKTIELIQSFKSYYEGQRYLLIVDPFVHEIPEYNLRRLPLIDDYYLPKNFEMLYATSDSGSQFFANVIFSDADKESKKLWKQVAQRKPNDMDSETAPSDGCTFFKIWVPTIYVQEIESRS